MVSHAVSIQCPFSFLFHAKSSKVNFHSPEGGFSFNCHCTSQCALCSAVGVAHQNYYHLFVVILAAVVVVIRTHKSDCPFFRSFTMLLFPFRFSLYANWRRWRAVK